MAGISTVVTIATPPIHNITPSTWSTLASTNSSINWYFHPPAGLPSVIFLHQTVVHRLNSITIRYCNYGQHPLTAMGDLFLGDLFSPFAEQC
jgi:hypothetical protein